MSGLRPPADLDEVLAILRARRAEAIRTAGVEFVGVVGSLARGDAHADSDVDVVFDAAPDLDYWRLGGLLSELSGDLGRQVDLVDRQMMAPDRWAYMSRDLVPVA